MSNAAHIVPMELGGRTDGLRVPACLATMGLAAKRVGGEAVFGGPELRARAERALKQSLIGHAFPGLWLEVPLAGEPGFDLHVYYDRGSVAPGERFGAGAGFGLQGLFDWFFAREAGGVGIGFAHDLRSTRGGTGAYVNFNGCPLDDVGGFFSALGTDWATREVGGLTARLPKDWRPWYLGVFPDREGGPARLGSFVRSHAQARYAADPAELAADLGRAGFAAAADTPLRHASRLAALPFQLETQLDLLPDGSLGGTLGVDLTVGESSPARCRELFAPGGAGAEACELLEGWGMADDRWKALAGAWAGRLVTLPDAGQGKVGLLTSCRPSFIKAKWSAGNPQPAKVYLRCDVTPVSSL